MTYKKFYDFQISFFKLNNLYSLSRYGDYGGNGNTFKLLADKKGEPNEEKLLNEAIALGKEAEHKYCSFRTLIKQKLYV